MMQQQSQVLQAAIAALTHHQATTMATMANKKPLIEIPSWDGEASTLCDFLFRVDTMKKDTFFATSN